MPLKALFLVSIISNTEINISYVAKTKALISFAVTAKLICVFVFAYVKIWFSHDEAHLLFTFIN